MDDPGMRNLLLDALLVFGTYDKNLEDVQRLIETKADLEIRDNVGCSALMHACLRKDICVNDRQYRSVPVSVVCLLLQAGVGPPRTSHSLLTCVVQEQMSKHETTKVGPLCILLRVEASQM